MPNKETKLPFMSKTELLIIIVLLSVCIVYAYFCFTKVNYTMKEEHCYNVSTTDEFEALRLEADIENSKFAVLTYEIKYLFERCSLPNEVVKDVLYDIKSSSKIKLSSESDIKCAKLLFQIKDEKQKLKNMDAQLHDEVTATKEVCNYTVVKNMTTGYCKKIEVADAISATSGDRIEYFSNDYGDSYICINYAEFKQSDLNLEMLEGECYCESGYDCKREYQCKNCYSEQKLPLPKCIEVNLKTCTRYRCFEKYIVDVKIGM